MLALAKLTRPRQALHADLDRRLGVTICSNSSKVRPRLGGSWMIVRMTRSDR